MKMFLITWLLLCFFATFALFIAYATNQLLGASTSLHAELEIEEECSPCEENLKRLKKAMEQWEREHKAQAVAASDTQ